jgi:hypothetical protein
MRRLPHILTRHPLLFERNLIDNIDKNLELGWAEEELLERKIGYNGSHAGRLHDEEEGDSIHSSVFKARIGREFFIKVSEFQEKNNKKERIYWRQK